MSQDNKLNDENKLTKEDIEKRRAERKQKIKANKIKAHFHKENFVQVIDVESYKQYNALDDDSDSEDTDNNLDYVQDKKFWLRSFFSNHIGKTILFLLAAAALGLIWYLIPALALAMQISLAVAAVAFVIILIIDQKKNFLPPPSKIFCGLISSEKGDDFEKKREEKDKEEPKKELDKEDKKSGIGD
ncbi:MAG: hypothetical protein IJU86_02340 [Firmicutes bacterium]|nr:hypothetical protein [Bacillota bacterium]